MTKKKTETPEIKQDIVDKLAEIIGEDDLDKVGGGYGWGGGWDSWGGSSYSMTCGDYNTTSWY